MFRSLFLLRRLLATTFLVVFVNVFVGQCYCASLRQALAAPSPVARLAAKPATMDPSHACCRKAAAKQQAVNGVLTVKEQQKSKKSDGCCRQKAASLLAATEKPGQKSQFSLTPALLPVAMEFPARLSAGRWDRTQAVVLVRPEHLPPKIPDIRIFIQSLTV